MTNSTEGVSQRPISKLLSQGVSEVTTFLKSAEDAIPLLFWGEAYPGGKNCTPAKENGHSVSQTQSNENENRETGHIIGDDHTPSSESPSRDKSKVSLSATRDPQKKRAEEEKYHKKSTQKSIKKRPPIRTKWEDQQKESNAHTPKGTHPKRKIWQKNIDPLNLKTKLPETQRKIKEKTKENRIAHIDSAIEALTNHKKNISKNDEIKKINNAIKLLRERRKYLLEDKNHSLEKTKNTIKKIKTSKLLSIFKINKKINKKINESMYGPIKQEEPKKLKIIVSNHLNSIEKNINITFDKAAIKKVSEKDYTQAVLRQAVADFDDDGTLANKLIQEQIAHLNNKRAESSKDIERKFSFHTADKDNPKKTIKNKNTITSTPLNPGNNPTSSQSHKPIPTNVYHVKQTNDADGKGDTTFSGMRHAVVSSHRLHFDQLKSIPDEELVETIFGKNKKGGIINSENSVVIFKKLELDNVLKKINKMTPEAVVKLCKNKRKGATVRKALREAANTMKAATMLEKAAKINGKKTFTAVSTSLLSPDNYHNLRKMSRSDEKSMLADQYKAFDKARQILNKSGYDITIYQLNTGVNKWAHAKKTKPLAHAITGRAIGIDANSERYNTGHIKVFKDKVIQFIDNNHKKYMDKNTLEEDREKAEKKIKHAETLLEKLNEGLAGKADNVYQTPVALICLANLMDDCVPLFNCKSGKDRTGMCENLVALVTAHLNATGEFPDIASLEGDLLDDFIKITQASGSAEITRVNTGHEGLKIAPDVLASLIFPKLTADQLRKVESDYGQNFLQIVTGSSAYTNS